MERRVGLRGRTDFGVIAHDGIAISRCRGIEISPTGIIVERGRTALARGESLLVKLELSLPERIHAITAWARPVWVRGSQQAFRFVRMSDPDRLTLAEHLDILTLRGALVA
ncbi:MAG: hypothetical protein L6Q84_13215 [Polyangiaceae bacterium]|jgi:hypothetical protein|nr:hypothetical protein [Polyangiaceae bacterium]